MILLLKDGKWTIWVQGWSACSRGSGVVVTYPWFDATTFIGAGNGVATVELNITEAEFSTKIRRSSGICDLQEYC